MIVSRLEPKSGNGYDLIKISLTFQNSKQLSWHNRLNNMQKLLCADSWTGISFIFEEQNA